MMQNPDEDAKEVIKKRFHIKALLDPSYLPICDAIKDITVYQTQWRITFSVTHELSPIPKQLEVRFKVRLLISLDREMVSLPVHAEFVVRDKNNEHYFPRKYSGSFRESSESEFIELGIIRAPKPNRAEFYCDVNIFPNFVPGPITPAVTLPPCNLTKKFSSFLLNETFSDVSIHIDGRKIPAHKLLLTAASPVFAALLNSHDKNQNVSKLELSDVSYEVMVKVLGYMYTEEGADIDEQAEEALEIAEKYQLDRLKAHCERALMGKLDVDNTCDLFIKADLYNANQLREGIKAFVKDHFCEVKKTEGFQKLGNTHVHLLMELLQAYDGKSKQKIVTVEPDQTV